jgi:hypothetical protein
MALATCQWYRAESVKDNVDYLERFKVPPGPEVKLKDIDPTFKGGYVYIEDAAEEIAHYQKKLCEL